ncbi:hypothetical protein HPB52_023337 [Rhipicephalus sanguineus]|uniref:C2H2-type domain-containing protein n=1 Tax=Rhipicephalus sanguineus TaxID=34632 RepID=A0A9D4QCF4_RHISA|nr:hypothetical protein HPB52_023337 [Rhipicephalus sanguineus]
MSREPLLTSLVAHPNIRGFPMTGQEQVKVLPYADDFSLFVRDVRSLQEFQSTFSACASVSGAALDLEKTKALLFGTFPRDAIGDIQIVTSVKVLGVYFTCDGVATTTWQRALERARHAAARIKQVDLALREKALVTRTTVCAFPFFSSRVAVIPNKMASELNILINSLLCDKGTACETTPIIAARDTSTFFLDTDNRPGPRVESPSAFYKAAATTMKIIAKEAPDSDIDKDPPARIVEEITHNQLTEEEKRKIDDLQDEEIPGRGFRKRRPPFLACLSRPGHQCLLVTTSGLGPCDHHRYPDRPGSLGYSYLCAWTCCPSKDAWTTEEDACCPRGSGPARTLSERTGNTAALWPPSTTTRTASSGLPGTPCNSPPPARVVCLHRDFGDVVCGLGVDFLHLYPAHWAGTPSSTYTGTWMLRCIRRGFSTSYGGASWTSRVQSLRRHLEREHDVRIQERLYVCSVCADSLPTRPSAHSCLASQVPTTAPAVFRHRCIRCPQAFPSARGLLNHERRHDLQDAVGAATGRRPPALSATGAPQVPTAPPSPRTAPTDSSIVAHQPTSTTAAPSTSSGVLPAHTPSPLQDVGTPSGSPLASPGSSSPAPSSGTASPEDPDMADIDDGAATPPVDEPAMDLPPDNTSLLGAQVRLLRGLIREPPTDETWRQCEEAWSQAVTLETEAKWDWITRPNELSGTVNNKDVQSGDARANSDNEGGVTAETVREADSPLGAGQNDGVTVRELLNALMENERVLTALLERLAPSATPQPVSAGTPGGIAAFQISNTPNRTPRPVNPANAADIQRLYCRNRRRAVRLVLEGPSRSCTIPLQDLREHWGTTWSARTADTDLLFRRVSAPDAVDTAAFTPDEADYANRRTPHRDPTASHTTTGNP